MKDQTLTALILTAARRGAVNLQAIQTTADVELAAFYSARFGETVKDVPSDQVLRIVQKLAALGVRKFRPACGAWLTDKEFTGGAL